MYPKFFSRTLGLLVAGFGASLMALAQPAAPPPPEPEVRETDITLEEIWKEYKYFAARVPGFDFSTGNRYTRITDNAVEEVDFATGETTARLFDYGVAREKAAVATLPEKFDSYAFSDDGERLLVKTNTQPIFRRSTRADFYVVDRDGGDLKAVDPAGPQMYASFSPDGSKVAYVRANNLWVYDVATGKRTQVTKDGKTNAVINGATDWVYEEEFAIAKGFAWAPDGKSILFLRFDETAVPEFTMPMFNDDLYPEYRTWKYPKVGEQNATVSAHVYTLASAKTRELYDTGDGNTHIPRIYYTPDSRPVIWTTNRKQNEHTLWVEPKPGADLQPLVTETSKTYYDVHDNLTFLDDGSFLWTSDRSGFNHIYHYGRDGKLIKQLTSGNYPVTDFYGYDEANKTVYFQAAMTSPLRREVYKLPLKGGKPRAIAKQPGWNSATFNADFSGFLLSHSRLNQAPVYSVHDSDGELVRTLEDNAALAKTMKDEGVSPAEFFSFTTEDDIELNGWIIKPEGFSLEGDTAYPLFMFQYSGPGSQQVVDSWRGPNYWWFQMLAQQGYVVACVDGRGTGGRGADFAKQTYLNLGDLELQDQVAAAKYLGAQPGIDAERIGIFGWSYGGYMSSLAAMKASDVFSLAIAVAPVTNWKWYDTLYTERYMQTLTDNADGYRDNSPIYFADGLEADYLLIHGMGDDNVHFQHSVEMANALVAANKDFEFYAYPNRNHGIYGGVTRYHLYDRMTEFINERL